jgi:hypothetical protein
VTGLLPEPSGRTLEDVAENGHRDMPVPIPSGNGSIVAFEPEINTT